MDVQSTFSAILNHGGNKNDEENPLKLMKP